MREALADHLVVFLPDQHMDLDDLERVTDLLGGRDTTPFVTPLEDRPFVIRVIKEPADQLNFANAWHSDLSYLAEPPVVHVAPRSGGPGLRRRHDLVQSVPGLRDPVPGTEGDPRRASGRALGWHGVRDRGVSGPGEGPHVHGHRSLTGGVQGAQPSLRSSSIP